MKRRTLLAAIGASPIISALSANGQTPSLPVVGFLNSASAAT
jgi:hypothetical protein